MKISIGKGSNPVIDIFHKSFSGMILKFVEKILSLTILSEWSMIFSIHHYHLASNRRNYDGMACICMFVQLELNIRLSFFCVYLNVYLNPILAWLRLDKMVIRALRLKVLALTLMMKMILEERLRFI